MHSIARQKGSLKSDARYGRLCLLVGEYRRIKSTVMPVVTVRATRGRNVRPQMAPLIVRYGGQLRDKVGISLYLVDIDDIGPVIKVQRLL